ncbi:MAG: hypothetical protein KA765_15710 [Thermoflexales bacterium]|nr:hypothetical protein [Thermoflexales bacterium]
MPNTVSNGTSAASVAGHLRQEFEAASALLHAQPPLTQRFVEAQARQLAEAMAQKLTQIRFTLPDRVIGPGSDAQPVAVPADQREQSAGGAGLFDRFSKTELYKTVRQRFNELEQSANRELRLSGQLLRFATAQHLVHSMLPDGRSVTYAAAEDESIPTIPSGGQLEARSAITATTDAIAEEGDVNDGRGELLVPYVAYARQFYLPQWVALDDQDHLLVNSINEAEAHLASMQRYMNVLHIALSLAPYIVADEVYQQKRYGLLGQLINQGRALARYETIDIVTTIKRRAARHELNRGLSLSLPYFDDQTLAMELNNFEVIPAGRIMFVPAFVVRAAREEQAKVSEDTRLSTSTRKYLLAELKMLEDAFEVGR